MDKLTHRLKNYIKSNTVEAVTYSLMFVTVVLSSLLVGGEVSIVLVLILLLYVAISLNLKSISEGYTGIEEKLEDIKSAMNIATKDRGSIKKMLKGRTARLDRSLEKGLDDTYSQIEHYFALQEILKPKKPIVGLSGWAVMPDSGLLLVETILREKKRAFVDIGSGVSTVLAAYAMKQNGKGRVISIDHDKSYYEKTKKIVNEHGLSEWVSLHYAPLKDQSINGKNYNWYDISKIKLGHVDMVFVDGPPHSTQDTARYPAIPLLYPALSDNATIILDDYDRPDEQLTVEKWLDEFPDLEFEHVRTKKGVALLTKG